MASSYIGHCHCGTVQYTFQISSPIEDQSTISCNCSYCITTGRLLVHCAKADFKISTGEDNLSKYRFGSKSMTASFCKTCGSNLTVEARAEGGFLYGKVGVNVRTVEGIHIDSLALHKFNGRDMVLPAYVGEDER